MSKSPFPLTLSVQEWFENLEAWFSEIWILRCLWKSMYTWWVRKKCWGEKLTSFGVHWFRTWKVTAEWRSVYISIATASLRQSHRNFSYPCVFPCLIFACSCFSCLKQSIFSFPFCGNAGPFPSELFLTLSVHSECTYRNGCFIHGFSSSSGKEYIYLGNWLGLPSDMVNRWGCFWGCWGRHWIDA